MDKMGIRAFCRLACGGTCCSSRSGRCQEPHGCEDKLFCTAYVCDHLKRAINIVAPEAGRALTTWYGAVRVFLFYELGLSQEAEHGETFFGRFDINQVMQVEVGEPPVVTAKDILAIHNMLEVMQSGVERARLDFNKLNGHRECCGFALLESDFAEYFGGMYSDTLPIGGTV